MAIWPDQVMKRDARIAALEAEVQRHREARGNAEAALEREERALIRARQALEGSE